jgi:uncharacterized protein (TIGR00369 family)
MAFDPARLFAARLGGHYAALGLEYHAHGQDWVDLALPYADALIGDPERAVVASGAVVAMIDVAASAAVWLRVGRFVAHATLDLHVDYLRAATPARTVIGRGECYRVARRIAFVRGQAHDGDPADPIAHVAGTFMAPDGYR